MLYSFMKLVITKIKTLFTVFNEISAIKKCCSSAIQRIKVDKQRGKIDKMLKVKVTKLPLICLWLGLDFLAKETSFLYEFKSLMPDKISNQQVIIKNSIFMPLFDIVYLGGYTKLTAWGEISH